MKVLIFSTAYLPHIGGAEIAVKEITNRLPDIFFTMITAKLDPNLKDHEKVGNIEVYRIGNGNGLDKIRLFFSGVKKAVSLGDFDIVWSIMASYAGFAAMKYKKITNTKFVLNLQEGDNLKEIEKKVSYPIIKKWFKDIFVTANYVHAISSYLADWAQKMGSKTIEVVPNGVDFERFSSAESKDKTDLSLKAEDKVVITTSRLVKKNGIEDLIRAVKTMPDNVNLLIAGEGGLKDHLVRVAEDLKIDERVYFLGHVSQEDLPSYLKIADVFCRPSLSEGLGISFLEAMAAGLPVVATEVGGIPDFLEDGKTGWFCHAGEPRDIADKINYVLSEENKEEVKKVVDTAADLVKEDYNWNKITNKIESIFKSL